MDGLMVKPSAAPFRGGMAFPIEAVRRDFPILERRIRLADGRDVPLCFLDHGASTHAPQPVLDEVQEFMTRHYANVHRGNHTLSQESSERFEAATATLAGFVGAGTEAQPLVLLQNTTQCLDLAAHVMAGVPGATLTTLTEHHSNDLPHRRRGRTLHAAVDEEGRLRLDDVQAKLDAGGVKLFAVTGASNVTGLMPPIHKLARMAHDAGARILVDAAQLYAHAAIDVKPEGHPEHLDFLAAAGHKSYAPFGSAFLLGPRDLMDAAPPYMPGGGTVEWVTEDSALFSNSPDRHMGGTPNIVGAIAFAAATRYLARIGMGNVRRHEEALVRLGLRRFAELESDHGVQLLGPRGEAVAPEKSGVFAFLVPGQRHADVSTLLDRHYGIATRNGCFCAHPLLHRLLKLGDTSRYIEAITQGREVELPGATRATFGLYNTEADVEFLAEAVAEVVSGRAGREATTRPGIRIPA